MGIVEVTHYGESFLFDGRAYMSVNSSPEKLIDLKEELKTIGKDPTTVFQLETLYDFHKHRGLPANTISVVAQLNIGDCCLIIANKADAKIRRLSKSFCSVEWIQK